MRCEIRRIEEGETRKREAKTCIGKRGCKDNTRITSNSDKYPVDLLSGITLLLLQPLDLPYWALYMYPDNQ